MIKTAFEQIMAITIKNLKIKLRNYQTYFYSIGFPILFTVLFYFMFGMEDAYGGYKVFDYAIAGMFIYAASFGTINAATSLTREKETGTLLRLDTTPVGRSKIFIGTLLSEAFFLFIQLIIMFLLGYVALGLRWYNNNFSLLIIGFLIMLFFGLSTLGIGIIISAFAKTSDSALGLAMMYAMPTVFLSGALIPFNNPIIYCFPPFYAYMLYQQIVLLGDNFWTATLRFYDMSPDPNGIPLWSAFLILLSFLIVTLVLGIKFFQRKTLT